MKRHTVNLTFSFPVAKWLGAIVRSIAISICALNFAYAACTPYPGGPGNISATFPATVAIPRDAVVGTVLATRVAPAAPTNTGLKCTMPNTYTVQLYAPGNRNVLPGTNIIPTGVAGIGYTLNQGGRYLVPLSGTIYPASPTVTTNQHIY